MTTSQPHPPRSADELFARHRGLVYRWAHAHGLSHEQSLDVVQESFARFIAAPPGCASEGAQLAWLRRVASNLAADQHRSRGREAGARVQLPPHPAPGEDPDLESHRRGLLHAMCSLPERQRMVIIARLVDELSFPAIADELGLSVPTVKTHFVRALRSLRNAMAPAQETPSP